MKHSLRYGIYLAVALILSYVLYYFIAPASMFKVYSKASLWEIFLQAGFMFFAIYKSKNAVSDSGASFKIALTTLIFGLLLSSVFRHVFSNALADELNPIFLEARKADGYAQGSLFNADPLETLERVELMENTIEDDSDFFEFIAGGIFAILLFCFPFALIVSFLSRQVLRFRKT